jgi:NADPH:quinone reductase-like Zn-dependent oxidoreductase
MPVSCLGCGRQVCVKFTADPRQAPADDEVTVQVKAAGLNFRDVMLAIRYHAHRNGRL